MIIFKKLCFKLQSFGSGGNSITINSIYFLKLSHNAYIYIYNYIIIIISIASIDQLLNYSRHLSGMANMVPLPFAYYSCFRPSVIYQSYKKSLRNSILSRIQLTS